MSGLLLSLFIFYSLEYLGHARPTIGNKELVYLVIYFLLIMDSGSKLD